MSVSEGLRTKTGRGENLRRVGGSGKMGYLRRGKWIRDEMFVSERGECVCVCVKI